jgi:hypothetical protein
MWNSANPMSAQQLGLDLPALNAIIQATDTHRGEMQRVNNQVLSLGPVIGQHMNSDAGRIMNGRLTQWNMDFRNVVEELDALNQRVTGVRTALINANTGAGQTAAS